MDDLHKYLRMLFGTNSGYVYAPTKSADGVWHQEFYHYPGQIGELIGWIFTNSQASDVYISPTLFSQKSAKKEYAKGSQVVWIEVDGQEALDLSKVPEPSMVVQTSSPDHVHIYWRIEFSPPSVIEDLNRRLTYHLEADSSGWDINQVLRPPGTWHHKGEPLPVILRSFDDPAVGVPHPTSVFDVIPSAPKLIEIEKLGKLPNAEDVLHVKKVSSKVYEAVYSDTPTGYRSSKLYHIACLLSEEGLIHPEIVSVLLWADEKIGKFVGRSDQLRRLADIASAAITKTKSKPATPFYSAEEFRSLDTDFNSLWADYLPSFGNLMLSGAPGAGKTQLSLQAACYLVISKALLGEEVELLDDRPILFFSLEMPTPGFQRLVNIQAGGFSYEEYKGIGQRLVIAAPGSAIPRDEIVRVIEAVQPCGIFYDSMSAMTSGKMSDEEVALEFADWDAKIRAKYSCFTWTVHHNRKPSAGQKVTLELGDLYGSTFYQARWDSILMLGNVADKIKLNVVKSRYGVSKKLDIVRSSHLLFDTTKGNVVKGNTSPSSPVIGSGGVNFSFGDPGSGHGNEPDEEPSG